jgi:hypothetical protein
MSPSCPRWTLPRTVLRNHLPSAASWIHLGILTQPTLHHAWYFPGRRAMPRIHHLLRPRLTLSRPCRARGHRPKYQQKSQPCRARGHRPKYPKADGSDEQDFRSDGYWDCHRTLAPWQKCVSVFFRYCAHGIALASRLLRRLLSASPTQRVPSIQFDRLSADTIYNYD